MTMQIGFEAGFECHVYMNRLDGPAEHEPQRRLLKEARPREMLSQPL